MMRFLFFDEEVDVDNEEINLRNRIPRPRRQQVHLNLDDIADHHLQQRYRLPRNSILEICDLVRPFLERNTKRSNALSVQTQVLMALRFLASGSFQNIMGDVVHVSQSSCSRILKNFCDAIVQISGNYIKFPTTENDVSATKIGFYRIAKFPNVIGCIDCVHIRIKPPRTDPQNYVNRKGHHSLNVQAVCNSDLIFTNLVVQWPGSTHDSFIWANCNLKEHLLNWEGDGWLLGDSGYPCGKDILTPFREPSTPAEEKYQAAHIKTRNTIERAFGVMKSRFRCLDNSGGTLLYDTTRVKNIVVTCCVLHNMCIMRRVGLPNPEIQINNDEEIASDDMNGDTGIQIRQKIVHGCFND